MKLRALSHFRLKSLLLVVLLTALLLGIVTHKAHQRSDAVVAILQRGGTAGYSMTLGRTQDTLYISSIKDHRLWMDIFGTPTEVFLNVRNADDDMVSIIARLPNIQILTLSHSSITDGAIRRLLVLQQLEQLDVSGTAVTNESLLSITMLRSLSRLNLAGTKVTDDGIMQIAALRGLGSVNVADTSVTWCKVQDLKRALPHCQIMHDIDK